MIRYPLLLILLPLLAGCVSGQSLPSGRLPGASSATALVDHAQALGTAWPLQVGGLAAILGGLVLFILGRRPGGLMLLGIGLLLCLMPGWILESLSRVTWLGAASAGAMLIMGVGWVGYKLFRFIKQRKECNR